MATDDRERSGASGLPSVSVIVPTYRYASRIEASVRAILDDPATTEAIVVVDGCRDGSLELLEAIAAEDQRLVAMFVEHGGKSAAQGAALARARGEVVLLLDQDVMAGSNLVTGHARHHISDAHRVVFGYMPTVPDQDEDAVKVLSDLYDAEYESHCRWLETHPELVLTRLWGGNISLRRDDCRRIGLEFPYFGHEDQHFGIKCLKAGLVGVFDRTLYAEHRHSRDAAAFLWYSKMQGASSWQIHRDHADVLGPYDASSTLEALPAVPRAVVALFGRSHFGDAAASVAATIGELCARVHWIRAERASYRLARRIELRTGASLAMAGRDAELARRVKPLLARHSGKRLTEKLREGRNTAASPPVSSRLS